MAKRLIFSDLDLKHIEEMSGKGMNEEDIADYFDIHPSTLSRKKKEFEQLAQAIKKGRSKGKAFVVGKLFSKVKEGNLTAIIFYLKTQCGWKEADRVLDVKFDASKFTSDEIYNLFNKMSYDQKMKIIISVEEEASKKGAAYAI